MLIWIFRAIFTLVILAVLFTYASNAAISESANSSCWWALVISGLGMAVFVFLLDVFTPKRKLSAVAGVFFGLLVGLIRVTTIPKLSHWR